MSGLSWEEGGGGRVSRLDGPAATIGHFESLPLLDPWMATSSLSSLSSSGVQYTRSRWVDTSVGGIPEAARAEGGKG